MSKRIGQTPFREVLPHSIAGDETVARVADALDAPLDEVTKAIPSCLIFSRLAQDAGFANPVPMLPPLTRLAALSGGLAELPDEVLDLLAWQLHLEAYETAKGRLAKCEAIFQSVHLHRKKGTPWAVYHALETLLRVHTITQLVSLQHTRIIVLLLC